MAPFQCCVSAFVTSGVFFVTEKIQKYKNARVTSHSFQILLCYRHIYLYLYKPRKYKIISTATYGMNTFSKNSSLSSGWHAGCSLQICLLCPLRGQTCWIQIERWKILSIKGSIFKEAIQETSDLILPECAIVRANITKLVSHCFEQPHNDSTRRIIFHLTAPCQTP